MVKNTIDFNVHFDRIEKAIDKNYIQNGKLKKQSMRLL